MFRALKVYLSEAAAQAEAARLNDVNAGKNIEYFVDQAHLIDETDTDDARSPRLT